MRQKILCFTIALVIFAASAQAQVGDWEDVKDLSTGPILVQAGHPVPVRCIFQYATDTALFCEHVYRTPFSEPYQMTFDRKEIRQISYQYYREGHAAKGALIGAGIGAAVGAAGRDTGNASNRVGAAVVGGGFGALFGSLIGGNWRSLQTKIVYQK
jgi:hypothetical protein